MEFTKLAHVETFSEEFEIENLKKEIKNFASMYQILYEKYENAVGFLSTVADSKKVQLMPKSAREKLNNHMAVAASSTKNNAKIAEVKISSPEKVKREELEELIAKHSSEVTNEINMMKGALQACLKYIENKENPKQDEPQASTQLIQIPDNVSQLPMKSPMRNRKLTSQSFDPNASKKISSDAIPSLMNGKYFSRPALELNSLQEVDLKLRADALSREYMGPHKSPAPPLIPNNDSKYSKSAVFGGRKQVVNNTFSYPTRTELESPNTISTLSIPIDTQQIAIEDPTPPFNPLSKEYINVWYNDFGGLHQDHDQKEKEDAQRMPMNPEQRANH